MATMLVVFIHGPAAAGKHTVGSLVAETLGIPLFHNHLTVDLVKTLFEFGSTPFRELRATIWRAAFEECARAGRSFVFTFHPEATVAPTLITELTGVITRAGGAMLFVELACSRATVLERLTNDSRRRFGKLTDRALYESIESQGGFEFEGMPEPDVLVDTDALEAAQAADVIVSVVRDGRGGLPLPVSGV
jgi:hypothetical protein